MAAVTGGASGALTYRVDGSSGSHLLRVETISGPLRNPHQYTCMEIAAEAGIAPPARYLDADAGVVILPFLTQRPLAELPGGPAALVTAVADLLSRLHRTVAFPAHGDHLDNLGRLLVNLEQSGRVAPGLLARHAEGFERIRSAYPWHPETFVSAHNDPDQFNVLYDGDRLWLIDWETAARNDPFIDLATANSYLGTTPELRAPLLRSGLGHDPTPLDELRLALMGLLVSLFAGSNLLTIIVDPASPTHTDLDAPTLEQFRVGIERGDLIAGQPSATHAFAKIALGQFADGVTGTDFERSLRTVAAG